MPELSHIDPRSAALLVMDYQVDTLTKFMTAAQSADAIIDRLRERAEALSGASFNAALANLYRTGRDSVGWHSDNEAGLGNRPIIASLSLGGERRFQFRHRETKQTITLGLRMGHWLIMAGETQRFWVHQVPKMAAAAAPRVNLSFRQMIP
jgi:alkylated DNA repair dioxygenase AlkB